MAARTLSPAAQRAFAAFWFAAFAAVATFLFFLRLTMAPRGLILYILLPAAAAAIAGCIWGAAILDGSRVPSYGHAVVRGLGVGLGTYLIFAVLFAVTQPLLEGVWSPGNVIGIFGLTLTLGILMGGPLSAVSGIVAGLTLYGFGRHVFADRDGRPSETTAG